MDQELFTTTQVAKLFGVTARTIQMWADNGLIEVTRTLGGHRRITADEIRHLAERLGHDLQDAPHGLQQPGLPQSANGEAVRLMFIDDDKDLLGLYHSKIAGWPHAAATEVHLVSDGYHSLMQIGALRPHIILLDAELPGIDTSRMLDAIRQHPAGAQSLVVLMSELQRDEATRRYQLPADVPVEEKPVSFARIQGLVEDWAGRGVAAV